MDEMEFLAGTFHQRVVADDAMAARMLELLHEVCRNSVTGSSKDQDVSELELAGVYASISFCMITQPGVVAAALHANVLETAAKGWRRCPSDEW